jgi:hypothetical protein
MMKSIVPAFVYIIACHFFGVAGNKTLVSKPANNLLKRIVPPAIFFQNPLCLIN